LLTGLRPVGLLTLGVRLGLELAPRLGALLAFFGGLLRVFTLAFRLLVTLAGYVRTWPLPRTTNFVVVSSLAPIGP
jgi:hypothetical protein